MRAPDVSPGVIVLLVVEQEGRAVGPDERAAQRPEAVGVRQELAVAEGDDRRVGQARDVFEVVGPRAPAMQSYFQLYFALPTPKNSYNR